MVKPVGSLIYGVKLVNTEAKNGKESRIIGWRTNWKYKPAWAIKLVKKLAKMSSAENKKDMPNPDEKAIYTDRSLLFV